MIENVEVNKKNFFFCLGQYLGYELKNNRFSFFETVFLCVKSSVRELAL